MPCPHFTQIWIFQIAQGIKTILGYRGEEKRLSNQDQRGFKNGTALPMTNTGITMPFLFSEVLFLGSGFKLLLLALCPCREKLSAENGDKNDATANHLHPVHPF